MARAREARVGRRMEIARASLKQDDVPDTVRRQEGAGEQGSRG